MSETKNRLPEDRLKTLEEYTRFIVAFGRKELLLMCRYSKISAGKLKTNEEIAEILYRNVYLPLNTDDASD